MLLISDGFERGWNWIGQAKKYTEDHEWIELSSDGKTGMSFYATFNPSIHLIQCQYQFFCLEKSAHNDFTSPMAVPSPSTPNYDSHLMDINWIKTGTMGISTYAAEQLGDVVFVELPQMEQDVTAGDSIGAVESVKSASDIMTPVSGTVVAVNDKLEETPALINKSPEQDGWIARIKVKDPAEVDILISKEAYDRFTKEEK